MYKVSLQVPVPGAVLKLRRAWRNRSTSHAIAPMLTLSGDRAIEWSYVAARIPQGPGVALDFGAGVTSTPLIAALRGYDVTTVDLLPEVPEWSHPGVHAVVSDLHEAGFAAGSFDLIINCSTVEHVGVAGRYGVTRDEENGDLRAMRLLRTLLRDGGTMVLTVPVGIDGVYRPLHRIYGEARMPMLLDGYHVADAQFWTKTTAGWVQSSRESAMNTPNENELGAPFYSLGCFVLQRSPAASADDD